MRTEIAVKIFQGRQIIKAYKKYIKSERSRQDTARAAVTYL